ncbi:ferrous iron transport protein A [Bacillus sp. BHET2]|uniref:FeoA family protein n=1 Tax=Bacillus sp. BHET2 TaxID=2583818 RepID=UPI00110F497A|nr:FeoA family protein [Bacillus sp. BHET2]TMU85187.1 ferrous iron transport protein A [Bacillus sp. BHET2]
MSEVKSVLLSECKPGERVLITSLSLEGTMRRRLLDLGFVRGSEVYVIQKSPLGDPMAFRVSDTTIALRKEESSKIHVQKLGGA